MNMTNRELFHSTMAFENGDKLLHLEQGFTDVLENWKRGRLPQNIICPVFDGVSLKPDLFDYFNIAKWAQCRFDQYYVPAFKEEVLEERNGKRIVRNRMGNIVELRTDGWSLPHEIDFAIKDMTDYQRLRERLIRNAEKRVNAVEGRPGNLAWFAPTVRNQQDHIVTLWVDGPFGFLRWLLGTEMAMVVPYVDPGLTRLILSDHLQVCKEAGIKVIEACKPDCCYVWEDSCYKNGPMVSPHLFEEFHLPWYKEWKKFLFDMGVNWTILDTDGDPTKLVALWMRGGVDGILPWEVNAVDVLKIAKDFPKLLLCGGIYKHIFERENLQAIDDELERVVGPLRKRGGYIASLDHWVFSAVSLDKFRYYCNRLQDYGKANNNQSKEIK